MDDLRDTIDFDLDIARHESAFYDHCGLRRAIDLSQTDFLFLTDQLDTLTWNSDEGKAIGVQDCSCFACVLFWTEELRKASSGFMRLLDHHHITNKATIKTIKRLHSCVQHA